MSHVPADIQMSAATTSRHRSYTQSRAARSPERDAKKREREKEILPFGSLSKSRAPCSRNFIRARIIISHRREREFFHRAIENLTAEG